VDDAPPPGAERGTAPRIVALTTGAYLRRRNEGGATVALLVNGGTARAVPGTWSSTSEYLAERLAGRYPGVEFAELRYRVKSWNEFDACRDDAEAALAVLQQQEFRPTMLIGFSMGGAVSAAVAADPCVDAVLGLAPWLPERLPLEGLRGKRFDVIHGAWDRWFPGIPGVSAASSRVGFDRALALGATGTYRMIPRALHGAAVRRPSGKLLPLPQARRWVDEVGVALERLLTTVGGGPSGPASGA
jgi:pimeloyl-ACP methyl ester carboxylesterase